MSRRCLIGRKLALFPVYLTFINAARKTCATYFIAATNKTAERGAKRVSSAFRWGKPPKKRRTGSTKQQQVSCCVRDTRKEGKKRKDRQMGGYGHDGRRKLRWDYAEEQGLSWRWLLWKTSRSSRTHYLQGENFLSKEYFVKTEKVEGTGTQRQNLIAYFCWYNKRIPHLYLNFFLINLAKLLLYWWF